MQVDTEKFIAERIESTMAENKPRGFTLGDLGRIIDLIQDFLPRLDLLLQKIDELLAILSEKKD